MYWYIFAAVLVIVSVASDPAQAKIAGTAHDLGRDVCAVCHTPHSRAPIAAPLWNRMAPATASFTMYTSSTMNMVTGDQPQGVSLGCLSCHDGVTSYNAVYKISGSVSGGTMGGSSFAVGEDGMANDHPISITYDLERDSAFNPAKNGKVGTLPLYRAPGAGFNQVECGSCHNPHDMTYGSFLRMDTANSALCLTCHVK